jgi:hypothetical protein
MTGAESRPDVDPSAAYAKRPIPNCYRVPSTQIIAGEYPGDDNRAKSVARICALLDAGVDSFVDLTEHGELNEYEPLLREEAESRGLSVSYHRRPIRDLRVPTLQEMLALQQLLGGLGAGGRTIYVHCWGGVGRTGTVIGCHLIELGHSPDEALRIVQQLFGEMSPEKLADHPDGSPETATQKEFVRQWATKRPKGNDSGSAEK